MANKNIIIPYSPRSYQAEIHAALEIYRFAVLVLHRRAGKTVLFINHLIKSCWLCQKERPRFSYIAPLYTQAKQIAWDYLKHYTAPIPGVKRNESELWVEFPQNGGKVKLFGADNPDSMRGLYHDGAVLDEPKDMKLSQIWSEVVRPALTDRGGWAAFIGTPGGIDPFFELYQHALLDPLWYTKLLTVDDTGIISKEELEIARNDPGMTEAIFRQEFYCDFTASSENIFIPLDIVGPAMGAYHGPEKYQGAPVVLSYDIARFGDDETVGFKRQGLAAWMIRTVRGADTMTVAGLIAQDIVANSPDAVFIDEGNMGAGVIDRLRMLGHKIIAVQYGSSPTRSPATYKNKRAEMWGYLRQWLVEGGAIPNDQILAGQISGPTYKFDGADRIILEKKEDLKKRGLRSPDRADALAQSFAHPVVKKIETNPSVQRAIDAHRAQGRQARSYNILEHR